MQPKPWQRAAFEVDQQWCLKDERSLVSVVFEQELYTNKYRCKHASKRKMVMKTDSKKKKDKLKKKM